MTDTPATPKAKKRFPRWAMALIGLGLFLILLMGALRWAAGSAIGRNILENQVESRTFNGQQVELDEIEGDLLKDMSIGHITLRDQDGVWAEIENARLRWSPFAMMSRHLNVSDFTFGKVHVLRRPVLPEPKPKDPNASRGDFPLKKITLGNFELGALILDKGVMPEAISASARANANWTPERARLNLDIRPGKDTSDELALHVKWDKRNPINGDFTLNGPENGLFATLLQLKDQSVTAEFSAKGDVKTITGAGTIDIDKTRWITLNIAPETDTYRVTTDIALAAHPLSVDHVSRLGPTANIDAHLTQTPGKGEPLKTVQLTTQTLDVALSDLKLQGKTRSAEVSARLKQPEALIPKEQLSLAGATLNGKLQMNEGISFDGQLLASDLTRKEFKIAALSGPVKARFKDGTVSANLSLLAETLWLNIRGDARNIKTAQLNSQLAYNTRSAAFELKTATLKTPRSNISVTASGALKDTLTLTSTGSGKVSLAELGLYETGQVDAKWTLSQAKANAQSFSLTAKGDNLVGDDPALSEWVGKTVSLSAKGQLLNGKTIALTDLNLVTPAARLTARGKVTGTDTLALNGQLTTTRTYPLQATLPGLKSDFSVKGSLENLSIAARATAEKAGAGENSLQDVALDFNGTWRRSVLNGKASTTGSALGEPFALQTAINFNEGRWALTDIDGKWQALSLTGDASGNGGDLQALEGHLKLIGDLPENLPGRKVDLTARITGETITASGLLDDVSSGPFAKGKLDFKVDGTRNAINYDLTFNAIANLGSFPQRAVLAVKGQAGGLDTDTPEASGTLNAKIGTQSFETQKPFRFAKAPNGLQADLQMNGFGGALSVLLDEGAEAPLTVNFSEIGVSPLMTLLGNAPMNGTLSAALNVTKSDNQTKATLTGRLSDLTVPQSKANPVSFDLTGAFDAQGGKINLRTPDQQMLQAIADIAAPLRTLPALPYLAYDADKPGLITAKLDGPIDNISAVFLPDTQTVKGVTNTELTIPLPLAANQITGRMSFKDGLFQHETLGADLEKINFNIGLKGGDISLSDFSAIGRKGGTLTGSGGVNFANTLESNLALKADRLVVVSRKEAKAVASGTLGMDLTGENIQIIGDLTINEGLFRLDSLPSSSAPTLNVQFDNEEDIQKSKAPLVSLNLKIGAPRSFKLEGSGMDAEISFDTNLTGTSSAPNLTGSADIVRGRFELLGKRFEFQESEIEFRGDPMQARLNIVATRQADDFVARVTISGTPEKPEIELSADPELPEDEVLSRVLFGRSPSQLSGLEAARLAAALASMSGGGGFDLMGGIENLTGFDNVDVSQNQDGQFQVATGRYLSDDVYLELSSSGTGAPGVSVEWEARKNVSVEAKTKPDQGQQLSIQWKKDFD